jgi:outer membrane lipoprotein-sorting protein
MAAFSEFPDLYELPNNTDVTELYVKSEKVMDIMCDVYKDTETVTSEGTRTWTFWVDPATGFTLKYEATDYDGTMMYRYEVTKLIIGKPDWDGLHLHPLTTDTVE